MGARDALARTIAKGIKAFHSSPHDFDKFNASKIGTGEGAQVYGHGLYFAENPAVSGQGGQYWGQFVNKFDPTERYAAELLQKHNFDRDKAILQARKEARFGIGDDPFKGFYEPPDYTQVSKLLESGKPVGPRTYEVNIAADPARMLNWDAPLPKEGSVASVVRDMFPQGKASWGFEPKTGGDFHNAAAAELVRGTTARKDAAAVANHLRDAGIPGIRYLDEGSRMNATSTFPQLRELPRTSNYVIFDPDSPLSKVDILKKYAVPGAIGTGTMGAVFDPSSYTAEEVQR